MTWLAQGLTALGLFFASPSGNGGTGDDETASGKDILALRAATSTTQCSSQLANNCASTQSGPTLSGGSDVAPLPVTLMEPELTEDWSKNNFPVSFPFR
jgi:hypothetical protein